MRRPDGRTGAAIGAALAGLAFAAALLAPARPPAGALEAVAVADAGGSAAPAGGPPPDSAVHPITSTAPPAASRAERRQQPLERDGRRSRGALAGAPRELLAYAVACGDLRAIEPRRATPVYRIGPLANACAPGWAPDGRLAIVGPVGRPPGSVSALRLLGRDGSYDIVDVPDRSITGRAAFWHDGAVDVCAVARLAPHRPAIYRREPGRAEAGFLTEGCFPALSPRGLLAYATPGPTGGAGSRGLRQVRVVQRDGLLHLAVDVEGSIIDLHWTGDSARVVIVTVDDGRSAVLAIDLAGRVQTLARAPEGALSVYAAASGSDIAIVRTRPDARVRVAAVDAARATQRWERSASGITRVVFRPGGGAVLLADAEGWTLIDRDDGETIAELPRLGGEPAWCCPPRLSGIAAARVAPGVGGS